MPLQLDLLARVRPADDIWPMCLATVLLSGLKSKALKIHVSSPGDITGLFAAETHPGLRPEDEPQGNSDESSGADSTQGGEQGLRGAALGPASEPGATRRFLKGRRQRRARKASRKRRLGSD